jgi:LacI family transcriptional regulator
MTVQVRDRLDGARRALAEAGLDAHVDGECLSLLQTADLDIDEGCRAAERLVGLPGRRRPTAAFCGNDLVALGLLQELTRQGVRVPEDVAIVGYDDIDFAAAAAVPLTSVRQPSQVLGRRATQLLLEEDRALRSGDDHVHQQIEFRPQLVVRSSTRPGRS